MGRITQAIKTAANRTGVDFAYLLNKASQESGFDPNAKASTSSATGLFQFTQQTWLQMVKSNGTQFGLSQYADHIQVTNGVASVSDPSWRQAILALRKDPTVSAEMAGSLDKANLGTLQNNVGGSIGPTDLYLAHFLGAGGASEFLNTLKTNPSASAASILPEAAASNPSVFYGANGQPRTVAQIYQHFAQKFDHAPTIPGSSTMMASATPAAGSTGYSLANAKVIASGYSTSAMSGDAFSLASLNSGSSPGANPKVVGSLTPEAPTLFTTMVLAQMGKADGLPTPGVWSSTANHNKKDAGTSAASNLA
jgi:hypothetical protein